MIKFIDNIICSLMSVVSIAKKTSQKALSVSLNKTNEEFALKLYRNSNIIVSKTQIHSFLYNMTCFMYRAAMIQKY